MAFFRTSDNIVDSGIYAGHQDLSCNGPGDNSCVGKSFGTEYPWYADYLSHGTHVTGTVAALGNNDEGVRGMIGDSRLW